MKIVGIIPARLSSERFPNKLIQPLFGKTIIERVVENALSLSFLDKVVIATDTHQLDEYVKDYNIEMFYMDESVWCGSQRAYYYYKENPNYDYYVSIPADEPLINPEHIEYSFYGQDLIEGIYTFYSPFYSYDRLNDKSSCKIVGDKFAYYFSRAVIPRGKDDNLYPLEEYKKHLGFFFFKKSLFNEFGGSLWGGVENSLAQKERLEQNIFIENGQRIYLIKTEHKYYGVDDPTHLERLENEKRAENN